MRQHPSFLLIVVLSFWLTSGCGRTADGPARRIVEGKVTYQNTPLPYGTIRFVPENNHPVATGLIENGRYRIENKGGVPLGTSRIEIVATTNMADVSEDDVLKQTPAPSLAIPDTFNKNSTLVETIPAGKPPWALDFHLK